MHVNKKQTPMWMRVVIILVAISFVVMLVPVVFAGFGGGSKTGSDSADPLFTSQYEPQVNAAVAAAKTDPTNPDIISMAGHRYYEWAVAVYESGQAQASGPLWLSAVSYYDQALALRPDDDIVLGNKAFALYYAASADAGTALQAFIDGASDNAGLAAQVDNARGLLAEFEAASQSATSSVTTTP
jgi:lipoprotein NlpI